ncbi:MAG: CAP domain-containing protein [Stappiaceae bacterium]
MPRRSFYRRAQTFAALGFILAACTPSEPVTPAFYVNLEQSDASVDPEAALGIINEYRANNGIGPLSLDPVLVTAAKQQAQDMAQRDSVNSSLDDDRALKSRLAKAGYSDIHAVQNVSAGYRRLAEAFSGWRDSKNHNAVMLDKKATRMGIGSAYTSSSKYKVFWNLILTGPS